MKILADIRLLARGATTGISGYTRDLLEALFKGQSPYSYQLFYNAFNKQDLPPSWYHQPQTTVLDSRIPNRLLDLSFRFFNRPLLDPFNNTDLIFSPHFTILPSTKAPRVITFHDLSFLHHPQFFSSKQKLWHWLQHYKKQAKEADHIIAVSAFTKSDLVNFLEIEPENISVIHSGINEELVALHEDKDYQDTLHRQYQFEDPFFLSLGTIEPRKNIIALIRAFSNLKERPMYKFHKLVIAGRPGYKAEEVFKEAKASPASKDIIFLDSVPDRDRAYLYSWARAFVYPSFFEGFGFPPLEAQACGAPVVASDRTSIPEILGDSALLFNPWSITELTEKLHMLETDAKLRRDIIKKGFSNAKRFRWSDTATKTEAVFSQFS